jgi:hypothetical protein
MCVSVTTNISKSFKEVSDRSNSGGGLLIYSKNDISISKKSELENNLDETIWVEIRFKELHFIFNTADINITQRNKSISMIFFEIDCDNSRGPGIDSTFPTSSIKWSVSALCCLQT